MARYFLNFGNKWEIKAVVGKEYGFTSNFDIPKKFARRKMKLARKRRGQKFYPIFEPPSRSPQGQYRTPNDDKRLPDDRSLEIFFPFSNRLSNHRASTPNVTSGRKKPFFSLTPIYDVIMTLNFLETPKFEISMVHYPCSTPHQPYT